MGSLKALNLALLTKRWWRYKIERDALWRQVIKSIHGDHGANPIGKMPGTWRNILKIHKTFEKVNIHIGSCFQVHVHLGDSTENIKWALEKSGQFSIASIRKAFDDLHLDKAGQSSFIWINWVPFKVSIHACKTSHCRLPTKSNLQKRGVILLSLYYALCGGEEETQKHLFVKCQISRFI